MATDIASIGFQVDTRQLERGQTELNNMAKAGANAEEATDNLGNAASRAQRPVAGLGRNSGQAAIQVQQFVGQIQGGQSPMLALSQQAADLGIVLGAPLLGSVVGIGAALTGVLASSLIDVQEETRNVEEEFTELIGRFSELSDAQQRYVSLLAADEIEELETRLNSLNNEAESLNAILQTPIGSRSSEELAALSTRLIQVQSDIDTTTSDIATLRGELDGTPESIQQLIQSFDEQRATIGLSRAEIIRYRAEVAALETDDESLALQIIASAEALAEAVENQDELNESRRRAQAQARALDREEARLVRQREREIEQSDRIIRNYQRQINTFGLTRAESIRFTAAQQALTAATTEQAIEIERLGNEYAILVQNSEDAAEQAEAMADAERLAQRETEDLQNEFESLSDSITDAIFNFESLGDVASSVLNSIARSVVQSGVNNLLTSFGVPGAPSGGGGFNPLNLFSGLQNGTPNFLSSLFNPAFQLGSGGFTQSQLASAGYGADFIGANSGINSQLSSFAASALPAAVLGVFTTAISGILSDRDGPRLTFGQGSIGDEFSFTRTDERESGPVSRTNVGTFGANTIDTAFGTFGSLSSSRFTQQVDQTVIDAFLTLVETVDGQVAGLIDESSVAAIQDSLSATFLPENRQFGIIGGTGSPESQLIARYTQIFGEALPQVFADQLLAETEDFQAFANNTSISLSTLSQSTNIFSQDITELAEAYELYAQEGETFAQFFTRVNQGAIADLTLFAQAIENTFTSIESLAGLSLSIREQLLTDEQLYDRLREQADAVGESIFSLSDPAAIQSAVAEYQQLTSRAFGLLADEQQQLLGEEIADSIDSVVAAATERTAQLVDEQENTRSIEEFANSTANITVAADSFGTFVTQFGDFVAQAQQASQAMLNASATLRQAAQESNVQVDNIYTGRL